MVRPDRERLQGTVQVDETYVALGDRELPFVPNSLSRKRRTDKLLVVMAVEMLKPIGMGRIRLRRIPTAAQVHVQPFIEASIDPAALVQTDGSLLYSFLDRQGYRHTRTIVQDVASRPVASLPAVNRVASLLKRWLLGTHHGAVQPRQLDHYLDEFVFRFNRRSPTAEACDKRVTELEPTPATGINELRRSHLCAKRSCF
jgi:transposase-like protein